MLTVGETAYRALEHLKLSRGQHLLVHGAGGAVGAIAVQLAVARGITVVGTAGEHDLDRVRRLGATAVRYGEGWAERVRAAVPKVDYVYDTAGVGVLAGSVALTDDPARVITTADMTFAEHGVRFTGLDPHDRFHAQALPLLADLVASGKLEVPVRCSFPLREAAKAHAEIEAGRIRGKVVIVP
jgi:NADPH:quinone reductase-like Zn-dependent oxidoreductase